MASGKRVAVVCIKCLDPEAVVRLDLGAGNVNSFTCTGCDEEFTGAEIQAILNAAGAWHRVLTWANDYPRD
jgi:hypothetical protein